MLFAYLSIFLCSVYAAKAADVCQLPKKPGPCRGYVPSYYYDIQTKSCQKFIYGGCGGNANRFSTLKQCEKKCGLGVCMLPKDPGPCKGYFPRYYYDYTRKGCLQFVYGGCKGNGNNFQTLKECQRRCGSGPICGAVCLKYCPFGNVLDSNGCPTCVCKKGPKCGPVCAKYCPFGFVLDSNGCPTCECKKGPICGPVCAKYCPFGFVLDSNGCPTCECKKDVCQQPKKPGPCHGYVPSYYYDVKTKSCLKFIYGGCGGNDNRFSTLKQCEKKCGSGVCKLPKDPGPCKGYYPRYYYDYTRKVCSKFVYGGCKGNGNNFQTLEECQRRCGSGPICGPVCAKYCPFGFVLDSNGCPTCECKKDVCQQPKKPGPCTGYVPSYYYDVKTKSCQKFIYGGCGGNDNRFSTFKQCEKKCGSGVCKLPKDPGPCHGYFPRYYYDYIRKGCSKFVYGGCKGNGNNFQTLEECQRRCGSGPICGPVCLKYCPFGNVLDSNGCPTCVCKKGPKCGPVCMIHCPFGYVLDSNGCPTCECRKAQPCPLIHCPKPCPKPDKNGCPTCDCRG